MRLRTALLGAVLLSCAAQAGTPAPGDTLSPAPTATAGGIPVSVMDSAYGRLSAKTLPGTRCAVEVHVAAPRLGDVPPASIDATADVAGALSVTYAAPALPKQTGRYVVVCGTATANADFPVAGYPINAPRFTARIQVAGPNDLIDGVTARPDPSLAPARDRDVDALTRTLVGEWTAATRGLSALQLVTAAPADIVITVVTARATSHLTRAADGSMAIFLFPADDSGTLSADNFVAVALHELGHIWCCTGPDASADGHWAQPLADPLLQGVDRFGLMNHPVQCTVFAAGIESCPNRFSERELRTMGFTAIPAPPRSACIDAKNALLAELTALKAQLATAKATVDASDAALASLDRQIKAFEAKYPGGMPADVYAQYRSLIDRYNASLSVERSQVSSYNALVVQFNAVVDQVNRLLC